MPAVRNAFKILAADAPLIDTAQFLQLYCPLLLAELQRDDLLVPKLILVRGSPGSGKSTLLRLFDTETLLLIHSRRGQKDQPLIERLENLGVLSDSGPRAIGLYIQCDSTMRDLGGHEQRESGAKLLYALLDVRI